jgi:membrane protein implicated in regulation of membrane protease activity
VPPVDAALDRDPDRAPARERFGPYAVVLAIGLVAAGAFAAGAERDPLAWAMPVLVVTALILVLITLIDGRPEERRLERAARELGLRHEKARTLPPVTPLLAALKEPRTVQALEGDLDVAGPRVRLATVRLRRIDLAVCLTDLPGHPHALEDPHGILEPTDLTAPPATPDAATAAWLADHPLRLGYATGDDALVVFCPVAQRDAPPLRFLLDAARELHLRLGRSADL